MVGNTVVNVLAANHGKLPYLARLLISLEFQLLRFSKCGLLSQQHPDSHLSWRGIIWTLRLFLSQLIIWTLTSSNIIGLVLCGQKLKK